MTYSVSHPRSFFRSKLTTCLGVGREGICLKPGSWSAELGARAHVESPARRKIGMTLAYFNGLKREAEKELRSPDDPNARAVKLWEQRIKLATNFADQKKPEMGTVLLASGFGRRTSSNRRLDWALIRTSAERLLPKNTVSAIAARSAETTNTTRSDLIALP